MERNNEYKDLIAITTINKWNEFDIIEPIFVINT